MKKNKTGDWMVLGNGGWMGGGWEAVQKHPVVILGFV